MFYRRGLNSVDKIDIRKSIISRIERVTIVPQNCVPKSVIVLFLTALRAGPPFSWDVTSGGPPGGRSLSKDGTRADSAKDFAV